MIGRLEFGGFGFFPCEKLLGSKRGLLPHGLLKYFLDSWKDWEFTAKTTSDRGEGLIAQNIYAYIYIIYIYYIILYYIILYYIILYYIILYYIYIYQNIGKKGTSRRLS